MCEIGNHCHDCEKAEHCLLLGSAGFEVPRVRAERQRKGSNKGKVDRPVEKKLIDAEEAFRCQN
jgi:hypothetical protein